MINLLFPILLFAPQGSVTAPYLAQPRFTDLPIFTLYQQATLVGTEGRQERDPNQNPELEKAQGRAYCLLTPPKKGRAPSTDFIKTHGTISNAVLALKEDVIILSRHKFVERDGKTPSVNYRNCYFEHIQSGEMIPFTDVEYPPNPGYRKKNSKSENAIWDFNDDIAVARLMRAPAGGKAIPRKNITLERNISTSITIISNYADNFEGHPNDALTTTTCNWVGWYNLPGGSLSNVAATDCDSGRGSSGAQAYATTPFYADKKLFGMIPGDTVELPDGAQLDVKKHVTYITRFGRLDEIYEKLESRRN
ncbi:hypothetical protein [Mesorhizobium sp. M2A.F.Ca.ET.039.01.1.1]|uniref:hypothetical protein n=1 Tax=Mesorhizobium sp. M2A.F.Ca.ET.039.01.1.1 TaxID=2496746 RepID=UPI000FCC456E|nr:hypothetical protein [Mesorhizobium sp. M2A.F.Ca.ET.039.01.1.1]RWX63148.1 hypothetical protein EOA24_26065 [Mesorhizobium sp. M2A.F.Ca.ET.039.01.1.1]